MAARAHPNPLLP